MGVESPTFVGNTRVLLSLLVTTNNRTKRVCLPEAGSHGCTPSTSSPARVPTSPVLASPAGRQTSALRLPRKKKVATDRILHAKRPPAAPVDQHVQETWLESAPTRVFAAEARQKRSNETGSIGTIAARPPQVHVRVGLGGVQDADRGQQRTVWAVARGEDTSGERACRRIELASVAFDKGATPPPARMLAVWR